MEFKYDGSVLDVKIQKGWTLQKTATKTVLNITLISKEQLSLVKFHKAEFNGFIGAIEKATETEDCGIYYYSISVIDYRTRMEGITLKRDHVWGDFASASELYDYLKDIFDSFPIAGISFVNNLGAASIRVPNITNAKDVTVGELFEKIESTNNCYIREENGILKFYFVPLSAASLSDKIKDYTLELGGNHFCNRVIINGGPIEGETYTTFYVKDAVDSEPIELNHPISKVNSITAYCQHQDSNGMWNNESSMTFNVHEVNDGYQLPDLTYVKGENAISYTPQGTSKNSSFVTVPEPKRLMYEINYTAMKNLRIIRENAASVSDIGAVEKVFDNELIGLDYAEELAQEKLATSTIQNDVASFSVFEKPPRVCDLVMVGQRRFYVKEVTEKNGNMTYFDVKAESQYYFNDKWENAFLNRGASETDGEVVNTSLIGFANGKNSASIGVSTAQDSCMTDYFSIKKDEGDSAVRVTYSTSGVNLKPQCHVHYDSHVVDQSISLEGGTGNWTYVLNLDFSKTANVYLRFALTGGSASNLGVITINKIEVMRNGAYVEIFKEEQNDTN